MAKTSYTDNELRDKVHALVNILDDVKLKALLALFADDYLTDAEIHEIKTIAQSSDWADWRDVRKDI